MGTVKVEVIFEVSDCRMVQGRWVHIRDPAKRWDAMTDKVEQHRLLASYAESRVIAVRRVETEDVRDRPEAINTFTGSENKEQFTDRGV